MVERLYGVIHGSIVELGGVRVLDNLVAPSRELMEDLLTLPPGTKVGLETCPELGQPLEIQGERFDVIESNKFYWDRIQRLCKRRGLRIVYLEDFGIFKKYLEKFLALKSLHVALKHEIEGDGVPERVMQQMHKVRVEAEYMFNFGREEKLWDRIQETQPTVAILGRGHTDPLLLDPAPLNERGISVGEYRLEEVFMPAWWYLDFSGRKHDRANITDRLEPDEKILLERELLKRRYRAVMEGRVMAEKTPDYIGTWDTQVPARGLFEVYLDDEGARGTIEDCLGTASFLGMITADVAIFGKKYYRDKSSDKVVQGKVYYNGGASGLNPGEIIGQFRSKYAGIGGFRLRKFDDNPYSVNF